MSNRAGGAVAIDDYVRLASIRVGSGACAPEPDADRRAWSALPRRAREDPPFGAAKASQVIVGRSAQIRRICCYGWPDGW
jgi:hypothetical protein